MSQPDDRSEAAPAYRGTSPLGDGLSTAATAAPARRRGGSGFLAGLIGGLLGTAAVLAGAGWYAWERGPVRPTLDRLAATEATAQEAGAGVDALGTQVEAVRGDLGRVGGAVEAGAAATGQLEQRVAANERALTELAAELEQAGASFRAASEQVIARMVEIDTRLAEAMRSQPADVVDKGTVESIAGKQGAIDQAQARLEGSVARVEQLVTQGIQASNQQTEALRVVVDNNRGRLDEVAAAVVALGALRGELATRQAVDAEQSQALAAIGQQLAALRGDLERRLQEVAGQLGELDRQRERSVAMAVAVDELAGAVASGEPFQPTVQLLDQLGGGESPVGDALAKLRPVAEGGVATAAELAQQLDQVAASLSAPAGTEPEGWVANTRANLQGLVDLHPADAETVPGTGAVDAARQALLVDDLAGAVRALEPLATAGNQQAEAWITAARARLEASGALDTLRQHVTTLLARQD